jgi:acetylglutamate kinase
MAGSVAKNILATLSRGRENYATSISGVDRNFLQHYPKSYVWDILVDYVMRVRLLFN